MNESELPDGWIAVQLGDVIRGFESGRNLQSQGRPAKDGEYGVLKVSAVTWGSFRPEENKALLPGDAPRPHELVRAGDVLISRANTTELVGAPVIVRSDYPHLMLPDKILRVLPKSDAIDPEFLVYALRTPAVRHYFEQEATGTSDSMRNLSQPKLSGAPLWAPPLAEQRRIVAKIETLTAKSRRAKEALDVVPPLIERFRKAVLAAAFRGDLTADWREKNPDVEPAEELLKRIRAERRRRWEEAELAKMRAKGKVPGDDRWKERYEEPDPAVIDDLHEEWFSARYEQRWGVTPLEAACDPTRGIPYGIVLTGDPDPSGVPTVRCGDIKSFKIDISGLKRVARKVADEFARTRLEGDEVLIAIRGTVGATAVAADTMKGMNISREIAMIPLLPGIEPRFVMYLLASPGGQALLSRHIKGVAQAGINLSDLRAFPLPLPSLDEQREIVSKIEALLQRIDTLARTLDDACVRHASLDRAILAKAFRGELVPQDPNDEPASVLLERLRAETAQNSRTANGTSRHPKTAAREPSEPNSSANGKKAGARPR